MGTWALLVYLSIGLHLRIQSDWVGRFPEGTMATFTASVTNTGQSPLWIIGDPGDHEPNAPQLSIRDWRNRELPFEQILSCTLGAPLPHTRTKLAVGESYEWSITVDRVPSKPFSAEVMVIVRFARAEHAAPSTLVMKSAPCDVVSPAADPPALAAAPPR